MTNNIEQTCICLLIIHLCFLMKCLFQSFTQFLLIMSSFLLSSVVYSEYKSFIRYTFYKYFCPTCGFSFHFLEYFRKAKVLNFDVFKITIILLPFFLRNLCLKKGTKILYVFFSMFTSIILTV